MPLKWNPKPLLDSVTKGAVRGVEEAASYLEDEIRTSISIQGKPIDRRSYPGERPRREFGDLMESLHHAIADEIGLRQKVGSPLESAGDLEFGTGVFHGHEVKARPFLRRALVRYGRDCGEVILEAIASGG